jgi:hypothetical protein
MSEHTISFVRSIVARFPGLTTLLDEHIENNFGEVLPHVFFGDVTRYVLSLVATNDDSLSPRRELRDVLDYLEEAYTGGDEELQELIAVSFLENLPRPGETGAGIRGMLARTSGGNCT